MVWSDDLFEFKFRVLLDKNPHRDSLDLFFLPMILTLLICPFVALGPPPFFKVCWSVAFPWHWRLGTSIMWLCVVQYSNLVIIPPFSFHSFLNQDWVPRISNVAVGGLPSMDWLELDGRWPLTCKRRCSIGDPRGEYERWKSNVCFLRLVVSRWCWRGCYLPGDLFQNWS